MPLGGLTPSSFAATLKVCPTCKYTSLQDALNNAVDGDTIDVGPGKYPGPFTITPSVKVIGAGVGRTILKGGGPVVTIGYLFGSSQPTVSISRLTITGGNNSPGFSPDFVVAGGVWIVPSANITTGPTVTITDSAITGNSVVPYGTTACPDPATETCAHSAGGGIYSDGILTLNNTVVSKNRAAVDVSLVTGATWSYGAGIYTSAIAKLTLNHSTVSGNALSAVKTNKGPNSGLGGWGGGISSDGPLAVNQSTVTGNSVRVANMSKVPLSFAGYGGGITSSMSLTVKNSTVSRNTVSVSRASGDAPNGIYGFGGGIFLGGTATIDGSHVDGNSATLSAPGGNANVAAGGIEATNGLLLLTNSTVSHNHSNLIFTSKLPVSGTSGAHAGALDSGGPLTIKKTTFSGNSVGATSLRATDNQANPSGGPNAGGGALWLGSSQPKTISSSIFANNSAHNTTASGTATAKGGAIVNKSPLTITNSLITGNSVASKATSGHAAAVGGGIWNDGSLILRHTKVSKNTGSASAPKSKTVQGGGIWNAKIDNPTATVVLINSTLTQNRLTAGGPGNIIQGGGLFNLRGAGTKITRMNSVIAQNVPDQCFGC
jgi:hypothetical protein